MEVQEPACKLSKNENCVTENGTTPKSKIPVNEMTSKDYYFDSYAHFGIHEGTLLNNLKTFFSTLLHQTF